MDTPIELAQTLDALLRQDYRSAVDGLWKLRARAIASDARQIAAQCLWAVARAETNLAVRARLERQYAREAPSARAFSLLAMTERDQGHLHAARRAYERAIEHTSPDPTDRTRRELAQEMALVDAAISGRPSPVFQQIAAAECSRAIANARPSVDATRLLHRLSRKRRAALARGDETSALQYLGGLVDVARISGSRRRAVQYARQLATECPTVHSLLTLSMCLERVGLTSDAIDAAQQASARVASNDPETAAMILRRLEKLTMALRAGR